MKFGSIVFYRTLAEFIEQSATRREEFELFISNKIKPFLHTPPVSASC